MQSARRISTSRGRRAFTLLEMAVTVSLFALFIGVVYRLWMGATRMSTDLEDRVTTLRRAQLALDRVTREIQQSRRLLYPAGGGADQPGVCVINGQGVPVMFALVPGAPATPAGGAGPPPPAIGGAPAPPGSTTQYVLYRKDLSTGVLEILLPGVREMACRVPAVPEGYDADLVHITLRLVGPHDSALPLVTSISLRALDPTCPLDRP